MVATAGEVVAQTTRAARHARNREGEFQRLVERGAPVATAYLGRDVSLAGSAACPMGGADRARERLEQQEGERAKRLVAVLRRKRRRDERVRRLLREGAVKTRALSAVLVAAESGKDLIQLVAGNGQTFEITRDAAACSGTLQAILQGDCALEGGEEGVIPLPEIQAPLLAEAVRYMRWREQGGLAGAQGTFKFDSDIAIELFRVAYYLDL